MRQHHVTKTALNSLVSQATSSRTGLVFHVLVCKARGRSAGNELHMYLICGQERRGLAHRPSPIRLRDRRELYTVTSILRSGNRVPRRGLRHIR
jgi:hypothetical protein